MAGDRERLEVLAAQHGLKVIERGKGHVQVTGGPLLVNWWPTSKHRKAYVDGTVRGIDFATPEKVIKMALEPPPFCEDRSKRKPNNRRRRKGMLKKSKKCHWCGTPLTLDTSTVDHVIPLALGGLDNANNRVLACQPCNSKRGHEMPEVRKARENAQNSDSRDA